MGLVHSLDEISALEKRFLAGYILGDAVMITAAFRTKTEVVRRVLPPPLEPTPQPLGHAYVAEFHRTNFGVTYNEAALFIQAQYKGEVGDYCLALPVTNDMALIGGREEYGYPKKIAETIRVQREGNQASGICIRKGIPIIEIKANLIGPPPPQAVSTPRPKFLFKHFRDPSWTKSGKFDYNPRLVKQFNEILSGKVEVGKGELTLADSKYDPISEIPVEEVLMASYVEGMEVRMLPGEVVAEVDPVKFMPYSFIKEDWPL